jgi:predicted RNA-binding Zn-ribbon protein involved in translation (DUF1610 family)
MMPLDRTKIRKSKGWFVPAIRYAWLTVKHRHFVFLAGIKLKVPFWRLVTHDLSKFGRHELVHYGRQFFGDASQSGKFANCWLHHQSSNDHHWEYWILRTRHDQEEGEPGPLPMPEGAIREMVADWFGASKAYDGVWPGKSWTWFENNFGKIILYSHTRRRVLEILLGAGVQAAKTRCPQCGNGLRTTETICDDGNTYNRVRCQSNCGFWFTRFVK